MTPLVGNGWLELILTGLLFGFGFAIGQTLWGLLVSLFNRKP